MKNITKLSVWLCFVASICATTLATAASSQKWEGIQVNVKASQPVTVSQQLVDESNGFQRLNITLSNKGQSLLTIEDIEVSIPTGHTLADDKDLLFGSSCMGRRPLLRHSVGDQGRRNYSYMFEMVRLAEEDYLFAGSLSWRIFLPVISLEDDTIYFQSDGEGKQLMPGESIAYEQIVLRRGSDWIGLLNEFGDAIAEENGITELKDVDFKGWATWDYYGRVFSTEDVLGNIAEIKKLSPEVNMVQIDGGWWIERGDYQTVRPDLVGGIKALADAITAEGFTAGLHFDGFRADMASEIYKTHPEYFLHDQDGNVIVEIKPKPDRPMHYIYFDYSHPGARAHIAACVETMKEWGITYFKVDFMRYGLESEIKQANPGVTKIVAYDPTLSGVERFRMGMQTIRDAIGQENYFLGCSAVFGPCIGFVDGMRTGGDVHPVYKAFPERALANSGNFYLAGKVYNGDCDYLVFREGADEDEKVSQDKYKSGNILPMNEAQTWADFNKLYGNARLQSDNLILLRDERKALVSEVFEWPAMDETIPLDVWERATDKLDGPEWLLSRHGDDIYLGIFNWGDAPKDYDLSGFEEGGQLHLLARHSKVMKYEGALSFTELSQLLRTQ